VGFQVISSGWHGHGPCRQGTSLLLEKETYEGIHLLPYEAKVNDQREGERQSLDEVRGSVLGRVAKVNDQHDAVRENDQHDGARVSGIYGVSGSVLGSF